MNKEKDKEGIELGDLFYRMLSKYIASEKVPRYFGVRQKLYPSEIHMIHGIGQHPNINVTDLAKFLGITKGAIPKMAKKLKSKELVTSFGSDKNNKEVCLRLTEEGEKAHKSYLNYINKKGRLIKRFYNRLTKEEVKTITKTLNALGRFADRILEK